MQRPTDLQLLDLWERSYGRSPAVQAVILFAACEPGWSPEQLLRQSVGQRDARLMMLRRMLFGSRVEVVARCPECDESLETTFDIDEVLRERADQRLTHEIRREGFCVQFRVPTSGDLIATQSLDAKERRQQLLERCVERIEHEGESVPVAQLPTAVITQIVDEMGESDPQADIRFAMTCPECSRSFSAGFDIVTFLWRELNTWAQRILLEIHTLARAYGWTQHDILAMSPWRRQVYLNMARQ